MKDQDSKNIANLSTRERILAVAGDSFGRQGYRNTTIRTIAADAQVNVAAINYHFRDKQTLYQAVLEDVFRSGFHNFPASLPEEAGAPASRHLSTFIRGMFYRLLSVDGWGGGSGRARLIARELLDPTPAFDTILERYIQPHKDMLIAMIDEQSEGRLSHQELISCSLSVIGQCLYYALASPIIKKISAENLPNPDDTERLDQLAEFVLQFSLGGIKHIAQSGANSATSQTKQRPETIADRTGDIAKK